jgi:hypothetical protein
MRQWRYGLRALLLAPLLVGAMIVLVRPTVLTGHFCYVTVDEISSPAPGSVRIKYRYCVSINTTFRSVTPSGGGGSSSSGPFGWYRRSHGQTGGGVNAREWGLSKTELAHAIKLRSGQTYQIQPNSELTFYELRNPKTGEVVRSFFSFYKNHNEPEPIGLGKRRATDRRLD